MTTVTVSEGGATVPHDTPVGPAAGITPGIGGGSGGDGGDAEGAEGATFGATSCAAAPAGSTRSKNPSARHTPAHPDFKEARMRPPEAASVPPLATVGNAKEHVMNVRSILVVRAVLTMISCQSEKEPSRTSPSNVDADRLKGLPPVTGNPVPASACDSKCQSDYETAAGQCAKTEADDARKACGEQAHALYKGCLGSCPK